MRWIILVALAVLLAAPAYADMQMVWLGNYSVNTNQTLTVPMIYWSNETSSANFWMEAREPVSFYWGTAWEYMWDPGTVMVNGVFERYEDNFTVVNLSKFISTPMTVTIFKAGVYEIDWGFTLASGTNVSEAFYVTATGDYYNTSQMITDMQAAVNRTQEFRDAYKNSPGLFAVPVPIAQIVEMQQKALGRNFTLNNKSGSVNVTYSKVPAVVLTQDKSPVTSNSTNPPNASVVPSKPVVIPPKPVVPVSPVPVPPVQQPVQQPIQQPVVPPASPPVQKPVVNPVVLAPAKKVVSVRQPPANMVRMELVLGVLAVISLVSLFAAMRMSKDVKRSQ